MIHCRISPVSYTHLDVYKRQAAYQEEQGSAVMKEAEILVRVDLARGKAATTVWTCDFSYDYVKINADYRS